MIDQINERTIKVINIDFDDEDGEPVIPTSATYRVDDIGSGKVIRAETEITSLSASKDIVLTADDTCILDEANSFESRRVTVSWIYNTATSPSVEGKGTHEYLYSVLNLEGVTSPA